MLNIQTTNDKVFRQSAGQILLDAAAKSGITLPYSCKNGRCSTCKCKVLSGQSVALVEELGLTLDEKLQGFILSCVRSALTDMLIDIEDLGDQDMPEVKTLPSRIESIKKITLDVLIVRLRLPPNTAFTFFAGQYIDVIGPGGIRRSYSIANAQAPDNQLELHIRAVQGGAMSHFWFYQAKVNDLIRINGPLGSFFMRPMGGMHLVFLATGTGFAPCKAMLEQLNKLPKCNQPLTTTIYWGGRELQDLYADPSKWYPSLLFVPVLSRAPGEWKGEHGHVQNALISKNPDWFNTVVYACGSAAMIKSAKAELTKAGLPDNRFYSDAFVPSGKHF